LRKVTYHTKTGLPALFDKTPGIQNLSERVYGDLGAKTPGTGGKRAEPPAPGNFQYCSIKLSHF